MSHIDTSHIHYSWMPHIRQALEDNLPRIEREIGAEFLPPAEDVFAALSMPLEDVRVLIVGQDPYPTPGHAMGLSFSTRPGVPAPRSLKNIYAELGADLGIPGRADGDLRAWFDQGVLLLNRVLTVAPGQAGLPTGHGLHYFPASLAAVSAAWLLRLAPFLPRKRGLRGPWRPRGGLALVN